MLTLGALNQLDGVRHGFFSREGGVSEGLFSSLNCGLGSGDDLEHVRANRARAAAALDAGPETLVTCHQVHSARAVEIDAPWTPETAPQADAIVTTRPGITLGVLTADCAPVLLADRQARVIAAVHAGWKGALTGVIEAAVKIMMQRGAEPARIHAGIGPCIAQRSYEVGPEFPAPFLAAAPANAAFFAPARQDGKFMFDLRGFTAQALANVGIRRVYDLPHDTCREERFFSYRRACLRGEKSYGRALSLIALES